ncbi:tRNA (guanine-N(7)-)-methyltransferase non-catalytic subunit trm82 [Saxophila tyrrhenica]|uniref:tRNA (Guanine-N(7)-)-methyltransferase non-catalytic subunit trm82 n=1 Tax=Saxophila tyrrhenica TaxID=1690608 RepID=A0AAV9PEM1_9PEZI|nr:tRNA (guanine-N(7)-)-methyltransferase non-catalytic subunit trm82 [Saxophila tyrrhenica]
MVNLQKRVEGWPHVRGRYLSSSEERPASLQPFEGTHRAAEEVSKKRLVIKPPTAEREYLAAACGSRLSSICLTTGEVASTWTANGETGETSGKEKLADTGEDADGPPAKKQKTAASSATGAPNIIKLTSSSDGRHAVAVTDDKNVRVFEVHDDGKLVELTQRAMPKRPCAIQVLPDNSTILCGDKFGDVYGLPLLPELQPEAQERATIESPAMTPSNETKASFKPSATTQTVHTKRNLKSLESQMKQKNLTPKTKQPLAFEHKLLLGHVSMLTDLTYASCHVDGKERGYIITADRDEHIRLSRAPPQSHIIEGYCLGHTQFVSKILAIPSTNLLVSGGGDEWIGVWDWPSSTLRWKVESFGDSFRQAQGDSLAPPIAVSGIWLVPADLDGNVEGVVIVACEKMSVLAYCPVSELRDCAPGRQPRWSFERFDHTILEVVATGSMVVVSFDARAQDQQRLKAYELRITRDEQNVHSVTSRAAKHTQALLDKANGTTSETVSDKALDDMFYGIAKLCKRPRDEAAVEEAEEEAADAAD